jgi:hypothetical protein
MNFEAHSMHKAQRHAGSCDRAFTGALDKPYVCVKALGTRGLHPGEDAA